MSTGEALSGHLPAPGDPAQVLAPLKLGDPVSPVLTLTDDPLRGHVVVVRTEHPTLFLGPAAIHAIRHWAECFLAKPSSCERESQLRGPELWTAQGIEQECGVSRRTAYNWVKRDGFPPPFAEPVGGTPVWEADAVRAWLLTSRPRAGRRPAS